MPRGTILHPILHRPPNHQLGILPLPRGGPRKHIQHDMFPLPDLFPPAFPERQEPLPAVERLRTHEERRIVREEIGVERVGGRVRVWACVGCAVEGVEEGGDRVGEGGGGVDARHGGRLWL